MNEIVLKRHVQIIWIPAFAGMTKAGLYSIIGAYNKSLSSFQHS